MSIFRKYPTWLIFLVTLGVRLQNALTIATFFQPDEYFQSLEVAAALRYPGGGYITWEWRYALRSILYPLVFEKVYLLTDIISSVLKLSPEYKTELRVVTPKIIGAITAAVGDLYTGLLARKIWGSQAGEYALLFSLFSAWNWFCSTRTFSNCFETTLTVVGMTYWPWKQYSSSDLNIASFFAALAFTVRPTNGLISWAIGPLLLERLSYFSQRLSAVLRIALVSIIVLLLNAVVDCSFYNRFTFPFIEFYRLNVTQSIAEFYGVSPWHYHHTQSIPLLLTGYLPLALFSFYKGFSSTNPGARHLTRLANIVPVAFMITKHKEFRFLYPLLPIFHVLMAGVGLPYLPANWNRRNVIAGMLLLNIPIAIYTSYIHQRGVVDVVNWLRRDHYENAPAHNDDPFPREKLGFLMPCHSTPYGSYLWEAAMTSSQKVKYPTNSAAWFLTCEPPVGQSMEQRKIYLDEADQFYANATQFLTKRFGPPPRRSIENEHIPGTDQWPHKLITFEATAGLGVREYLLIDDKDGRYKECKRFFNSHFHDDWRRNGDVIVWCLT